MLENAGAEATATMLCVLTASNRTLVGDSMAVTVEPSAVGGVAAPTRL